MNLVFYSHIQVIKRCLKVKHVYKVVDIMVNYQNGQIYKIWDVAYTKCYVGSTVEDLKKRFRRHRENYQRYKNGGYHFVSSFLLFDEFGVENCKIEWVENCPCNTKRELEKREGEHQKETDCVNKRIAGRTIQEYNEDNRERIRNRERKYRERNQEHIQQRKHDWYEKMNVKYTCCCGATTSKHNHKTHEKSKKHQQYLQNQNNPQE